MPVLIYTSDLREKDGETLSASDVSDNFIDIQDMANGLDWMNIEPRSLDTYHTAIGEQPKDAAGLYRTHATVSGSGSWHNLASVVLPNVREGDGVFVVGSVSYDGMMGLPSGPGASSASNMANQATLRVYGSHTAAGGAAVIGDQMHMFMDNPEVHGQAGITWAYQCKPGMASDHTITLSVTDGIYYGGGVHVYPNWFMLPIEPMRASLVVFVVHR